MEQQITNFALILGLIMGASSIGVVLFVFVKNQTYGVGGIFLTLFGVVLLGLSIWKTIDISVSPNGEVQAKFQSFEKEIRKKLAETSNRIDEVTKLATMMDKVDKATRKADIEAAVELDKTRNARHGIGLVCDDSPLNGRYLLLATLNNKRLIEVFAKSSFKCDQHRDKEIIRLGNHDYALLFGNIIDSTSFARVTPASKGYKFPL